MIQHFYTFTIIAMTNYDVDLELKEQQISLYEDELTEFINKFYNEKEFREELKKDGVYIMYEDYDECFGLYIWDDIVTMDIHLEKCLEKAFNYLRNKELVQSDLPF